MCKLFHQTVATFKEGKRTVKTFVYDKRESHRKAILTVLRAVKENGGDAFIKFEVNAFHLTVKANGVTSHLYYEF